MNAPDMKTLLLLSLLVRFGDFMPPPTSPPTNQECDYEHEIRTYFCRGMDGVFPNKFYGNYNLRCIDCRLERFTQETFPYSNTLISFNVSESGIRRVGSGAFSKLTNVQYIYLHNNDIVEIQPGAFAGLRQVYELHLQKNKLRTLAPQFLEALEVSMVDLSMNKLEKIPNHAFAGSLGVLVLDLSNNVISQLDPESLSDLENIEIINLEKNKLCALPLGVFKHLDTLRQLNLADNKLSTFVTGAFSGLRNLISLNLANNSMVNFDGNALLPFNHLSKLDISGNGIFYFDADIVHLNVPSLKILRMDDNLFSCSLLMNIVRYFKKVNVEVVNTVGRYDVLNVNGIACTDIEIIDKVNFDLFLKHAKETAKNYVKFCPA